MYRDCLRGNKNRHRVIKKAVEQQMAVAHCDIVQNAIKFNKKKALKLHPDFFPGDPHRDRKLTKAVQTYMNTLQQSVSVPTQPRSIVTDIATRNLITSQNRSAFNTTETCTINPDTTNQIFSDTKDDDPALTLDTARKAILGGGINLFPVDDDLSARRVPTTVVDTMVNCRINKKPSSKVKHPTRLRPPVIHSDDDVLPVFPIWFMSEDSSPERFFLAADIRMKITWDFFRNKYVHLVNSYNIHASGGFPGELEVIHAYHFPHNGQDACAPAPVCVAGMPSNSEGVIKWYLSRPRLSVLFDRLVHATGINPAMVLIPKSPLSMFGAFASSHYAAVRKGAAKTKDELLKSCVFWLLKSDCKNACTSTNNLSTEQRGSVKSINSRCLMDVWCEIMSLPIDTHDVEKKSRMRQHLNAISFKLGASYSAHFPKLNKLFVMVLCEIYKSTLTIFENPSGRVCTYRRAPTRTENFTADDDKHHLVMLKVEDDEYFGVFDLDAF